MKKRKSATSQPVEDVGVFGSASKRRKLNDNEDGDYAAETVPPPSPPASTNKFVWAQVYTYPYWPAKVCVFGPFPLFRWKMNLREGALL